MPGSCSLEVRKLTSQSPSVTVEFSVQHNVKITSVIISKLSTLKSVFAASPPGVRHKRKLRRFKYVCCLSCTSTNGVQSLLICVMGRHLRMALVCLKHPLNRFFACKEKTLVSSVIFSG